MTDTFKIQPKNIYNRLTGEIRSVATSAILRPLPYIINSNLIQTYIELFDESNNSIYPGYNKTFPAPSNWENDDSVLVPYIASQLGMVIVAAPVIVETAPEIAPL